MLAPVNNDSIEIRDVWSDNLEQEFRLISDIVDKYPYVGMDTEFPGTVLNPAGIPKDSNDYNYCALKVNVNILKLIQVGLTFSDEKGNLPTCGTDKYIIWQFNFREFSPDEDEHIKESIQMLRESGIDFSKNREKGVNVKQFGALLMSSGVVLNDDVQWVTFHGGIDFGYLLKLLTCKDLPETEKDFFELLNTFFPVIYDIKYLIKFTNGLYGGLSSLAQAVGVERVGVSHQAGSDSLLTVCIFIKMKEYNYVPSMEKYAGVLYRLGSDSRY